jgi:hypothetical protein
MPRTDAACANDGPQPGGRVRPDGAKLEWQTGRPLSEDLPFLCGDITPRHLRVAEGDVRNHANGVRGVASLTVAVHDLNVSLARYQALLGSFHDVRPVALPGLGVISATLALGNTAIVLLSSAGTSAGESAAGAALRRHLATRGEGLRRGIPYRCGR